MARSPPCLCLNWALCMIRGPGACRKLAHIQFTVEVPWTPQACVLLCPGPLSSNPFQGGKLGQIGKACHCFTDTEAELDQHPRNLMTVGCPPSWWHSRRQPWALGLLEILATGIGLRCGRQTGLRLLDLERHSQAGRSCNTSCFYHCFSRGRQMSPQNHGAKSPGLPWQVSVSLSLSRFCPLLLSRPTEQTPRQGSE